MCGICGIWHSKHNTPVDRGTLERMASSLAHRGPDDKGYYFDRGFGMAMQRLSIIDIARGQQPISNEDGSVVVVFNGEIYNFQVLRRELTQLGHRFKTDSDTEVIIHAYETWGDASLLRFNGMFAIALWDAREERLLLARDRMGKKPLYWHFSSQGLVWGSEIKAILALPWIERQINPLALHHYLTLQYTPDPLTIYSDIQQLPAAHKLVLKPGSQPKIERWWQLEFYPKWKITDRDAIQQARVLVKAAVHRRLISEVPLGAFLSGGIDSSIIVALMSEVMSEPVKTFSIGFEERQYDESKYARRMAERCQTEHHEFTFRSDDLTRVIDGVITAADGPFADPAALPLYELARQARQHVTVALCGDGGDETLAGYRRYAFDGLLNIYANLPTWVNQRLIPAFIRNLPESSRIPEDRNPVTGLKRLGQFSVTSYKASLVRWGSYFSHADKLNLYTDAWCEYFKTTDTANWIAETYDQASADNLLDRTLSADHATYLAGDLLPKTDRMTMAHSLEARAPLLDSDWVEWTARLPVRFKVRNLHTKWLLKAAFTDLLPSTIIKRGKQGFGVPVGLWLRRELRGWARERLIDNPSLAEWFRPRAVERLLIEHDEGKINHGKRLWALLMFAVWLEKRR